MFGGVGLYCDEFFFGLIARDTLYLKVDDSNREDYVRAGMKPFQPYPDRPGTMQYYDVPVGVLESAPERVEASQQKRAERISNRDLLLPVRWSAGYSDPCGPREAGRQRERGPGRLTRLGEMAAVVAHEVKNPLAGIRGALQIIGTRLPADSRDRSAIGDILARLDSLNNIVQDLLLFARPRAPRADKVALGSLIEGTIDLLRKDPNFARMQVDVRGGNPVIEGDVEQLQTVFMNLLINAAQAMGGAGQLDVSLASRNGRCDVTVRDHGPGIPPEVRDRIFEPFFTTKHRGTGLGLPTAKRVVELHKGTIEVFAPADGGTLVRVSLPLERR